MTARLRRLAARHTPPQCPRTDRLPHMHDMLPTAVYAGGRVGWTCAQCRYSTATEAR